jgi:hypothetical protein
MLVVAFDPALLAIPNSAESEEEVEQLLDRLLEWSRATVGEKVATFARLTDVVDLLVLANCYPSGDNIRALLSLFNLNHIFSHADIRTAINGIIQRSVSLSQALGVEIVDCGSCRMVTAYDIKHSDEKLRDGFIRTIGSIAIANSFSPNPHPVSRMVPGVLSDIGTATAWYTCDSILGEFPGHPISLPVTLYGVAEFVTTYDELLSSLDARELWKVAMDDSDIRMSIIIEALRLARQSDPSVEISSLPVFHLGPDFVPSLGTSAAAGEGPFGDLIRRCCARVLLDLSNPPPQPFRTSADSLEQKTRLDGAKAWRVHITKSHEALRLMYWRRPKVGIEFANVGSKSELWISDRIGQRHSQGSITPSSRG